MELFQLFGSILVDNEKANASIAKTDKEAEKLSTKFSNGIKTVGKWGTAIAAAATVAGGALLGVANNSASAMDEIDKMSAKIGISKQGYQEWAYVMGQNGMEIEKMQVGMKTLVSQMDGVASGNKNATEMFNKLGLSVYDATGKLKDQETMMNETMFALADMENGTEKARLATELFGKSGVEMMPMLNGGSEGMRELTARAHELGLVVSDEAVTSGVVFGDTMDDVKASLGMVGTRIGNEIIPIFQKMAEWVITNVPVMLEKYDSFKSKIGEVSDFIQSLNTWFKEHQTLLEIIAIAVGTLTVAIIAFNAQNILTTAGIYALIAAEKIHAAVTAISTTATTAFGTAMAFLTSPVTLVIAAIGALIAVGVLLYKNWDEVKAFAVSTWEKIKNAILTPIENAKTKIKNIIDTIKGFFNFSVSLPKIKLPHFSIKPAGWELGDLLKGKIPKLGIEWYAKAMDDGMILDSPTIFGAANGKLLGAGEAGSETIVGTKSLMSMIQQAVDNNSNRSNILLEEMVQLLQIVSKNQSKYLMLDKDTLIGAIADDIDMALGNTTALRLRGVR